MKCINRYHTKIYIALCMKCLKTRGRRLEAPYFSSFEGRQKENLHENGMCLTFSREKQLQIREIFTHRHLRLKSYTDKEKPFLGLGCPILNS